MIRLFIIFAVIFAISPNSQANDKTIQSLDGSTLFLEEIVRCMAFQNIRYSIKLKENNLGSAQKALLYHQQLMELASGLARETNSIAVLPKLHHKMIENILGEMENRYSMFHQIEDKYVSNCNKLFTKFDGRRKHWMSRENSILN